MLQVIDEDAIYLGRNNFSVENAGREECWVAETIDLTLHFAHQQQSIESRVS